jgi:SM-20-related protein
VPQADPNQFQDIAPADNMIVFFDSRLMHEVQPLKVPSGAFEDGRFTLNGWLNR